MSKSRETQIKQLNKLQKKLEAVALMDNSHLDLIIESYENGTVTEKMIYALALELRCKRLHDKLYGY